MTDQEILTKAIRKAVDGGWWSGDDDEFGALVFHPERFRLFVDGPYLDIRQLFEGDWVPLEHWDWHVNELIFNHDFAKALWPGYYDADLDRTYAHRPKGFQTREYWKVRLEEMVIADDPIKYLGDNLPK